MCDRPSLLKNVRWLDKVSQLVFSTIQVLTRFADPYYRTVLVSELDSRTISQSTFAAVQSSGWHCSLIHGKNLTSMASPAGSLGPG
jgi:hypothetical protein